MPRTTDSIVANHLAAASLRVAGKPIWTRKISIKTILDEDKTNTSPEHVVRVSNRIAQLLRSQAPKQAFDELHADCNYDFLDTVDSMEGCTIASLAEDLEVGMDAGEMLRSWLEVIYDWADAHRIWLGN